MVCAAPGEPLRLETRPPRRPGKGEVVVRVHACGVCRTDLHVVDGEIAARYPIVPGHEIVGEVEALGPGVEGLAIGARVGVPWLGHSCARCEFCRMGRENLCDHPQFTGATRDGGYASHVVADARYCFALPDSPDAVAIAPLLCAGLIGWRAYKFARPAKRLGLYGFGAAAHILAQLALREGCEVYAFTRKGDTASQQFARKLGCQWAGASEDEPPTALDSAIIFAPVGALVPIALKHLRKGGKLVCAGIHMSDIPSFPYADLWGERAILSVANLTREDGHEFLQADRIAPLITHTTAYPLEEAGRALDDLRHGRLQGAAVLVP